MIGIVSVPGSTAWVTVAVASHLLHRGLLDEAGLRRVQAHVGTDQDPYRMADALVRFAGVAERDVAAALASLLGVPTVVLLECTFDLRSLAVAPSALRHYRDEDAIVLPLAVNEDAIVIATDRIREPEDMEAQLFTSGRRVEVLLAVRCTLLDAVGRAQRALGQSEVWLRGPGTHHAHPVIERIEPTCEESAARKRPAQAQQAVGVLRVKRISTQRARSLPTTHAEGSKVLVVDGAARGSMLAQSMSNDGCVVQTAHDWASAWQLMHDAGAAKPTDLVVMDPELTSTVFALQFCQRIRTVPGLAQVPLILLGRSAQVSSWTFAFEQLRAVAYLPDPIDVWWLRHEVNRALHRPLPSRPLADADAVREALAGCEDAVMSGNDQQLRVAIERWLTVDPYSGQAWMELAQLPTDDAGAPLLCIERAVAFEPTLVSAQLMLARLSLRLSMPQRARQVLATIEPIIIEDSDRTAWTELNNQAASRRGR
jgi:DNA-binding response OmpR family regulator